MSFINEDWDSVYSDLPRDVEVILGSGRSHLESFLEARRNFYKLLVVSRPQNMAIVNNIRSKRPELFKGMRVFYDAEALAAMRDITQRTARGDEVAESELDRIIGAETAIARNVDLVLTVSEQERSLWKTSRPEIPVDVLGHCLTVEPQANAFAEREGILFVGTIHDDDSPNADAVRWFVKEIFPLVQKQLASATFTVAGINYSENLLALGGPAIRFTGYQQDLSGEYARARIFVAPSRIAAGLPLKVYEAAAHGLPVIATSVLGAQIGWDDGTEILIADSPSEFAAKSVQLYREPELWGRIRDAALHRVRSECSRESFEAKLRKILSNYWM